MQVAANTVVSFHYKLTNNEGQVLDQSGADQPMAYLHGQGQIIPGLEKALEGKAVGDKLSVTVQPEEAYGLRREELLAVVPRERFQGTPKPEVGMQFRAQGPQGMHVVTVVGFDTNGDVKIDGNHPLAGVVLNFAVDVVEVRAATEEELSHGHAHGPDGHHH